MVSLPAHHTPMEGDMQRPAVWTELQRQRVPVFLLWTLLLAGMACLPAPPSRADDTAQANHLLVEAIGLLQAAEREPSADGKYRLLKQAHDNLVAIIERYPSTDLAVKLATGQRIGNLSLETVRSAMNQARGAGPAQPGAPVRAWRHATSVIGVAVLARGRQVLFTGTDGVAALYDVETGDLLRRWQHRTQAVAAATSPGARRVLTASRNGLVALRDVATGQPVSEWEHDDRVSSVALSRDGRTALVGAGFTALLVDVNTLSIRQAWRHRALTAVSSVAYTPDGRWIFAGFTNGRVILGDARTGRTVHEWADHTRAGTSGVKAAVFSADGRRVLYGGDLSAVLRDVASGSVLQKWRVPYRVTALAFSRDGRWVLTGDADYQVQLREVASGRTLRVWRYDALSETLAFSPDGRRALMGFGDGAVIVCDVVLPRGRNDRARTQLTLEGGCW